MAQKMYCTSCGYVGNTKTAVKGNLLIEIILWLCFLVPGLIYSIWRSSSRHKVCPVCKKDSLIPIESPVAQKALKDQGADLAQLLADNAQNEKKNSRIKTYVAIGAVICFAYIFYLYFTV